jgi:hypothetical protein
MVCVENAKDAPLDLQKQVFLAVQAFSRETPQWDDMNAVVFHYARADEVNRYGFINHTNKDKSARCEATIIQ